MAPSLELPAVSVLLPHAGHMVLLDKLLSCSETTATAQVDLQRPSVFHDHKGRVPSYVGVEYILQTVSAMMGYARWKVGEAPLVGLVMGSREVVCHQRYFPAGGQLLVEVQSVLQEDILGVFDGRITLAGEPLCKAQVKAIQPKTKDQLHGLLDVL